MQTHDLATEKQRGKVGYLLNHIRMDRLGIPEVTRGRADWRGVILDAVIARSDRWLVSELIEALVEQQDEKAMMILQNIGYFDELDRANATTRTPTDGEPSRSAEAMA